MSVSKATCETCGSKLDADEKDVLINALRRQVDNLKTQVSSMQAKDKKIAELESLLKACSKVMDWADTPSGKPKGLSVNASARRARANSKDGLGRPSAPQRSASSSVIGASSSPDVWHEDLQRPSQLQARSPLGSNGASLANLALDRRNSDRRFANGDVSSKPANGVAAKANQTSQSATSAPTETETASSNRSIDPDAENDEQSLSRDKSNAEIETDEGLESEGENDDEALVSSGKAGEEDEDAKFEISVLRFEEDSPRFKAQVWAVVEECDVLEHNIEQVLDASRKWQKRARDLQDGERAFAAALKACKTVSQDEDFFGTSAGIFGEILLGMANARENSIRVLETAFAEGIENYAKNELALVHSRFKANQKSFTEYQSALTSFLNVKRPVRHKSVQQHNQFSINLAMRESDALLAYEQYELTRFDLVSQINRVRIKKQNELAESIVRGLFAVQTSIHQNYERIIRHLPALRRQQNTFPSTHAYLQQCESAFVQIRFELNRKLCRSVRLRSTVAESLLGGTDLNDVSDAGSDMRARPRAASAAPCVGESAHDSHRRADESRGAGHAPGLGLASRQPSSASLHARSQSASPNSVELLRRMAFKNHGHSLSGGMAKSQESKDGLTATGAGGSASPDPITPAGALQKHSRSMSDEGRRLRSLDSFVLLKKSPALSEILHTPNMLISFLRYLIREGRVTHISFWLDAERYRTLEDKFSRRERAAAIMQKYVNGELDLQLSSSRVEQLRAAFEATKAKASSISRSFFDLALREVVDILRADEYTKFLRSDLWLNLAFPHLNQETPLSDIRSGVAAAAAAAATSSSTSGGGGGGSGFGGSKDAEDDTPHVLDPSKMENLIPAHLASSLHLIDFEPSSSRQPASVRCLLDNKSRVIVNGPYDPTISEAFNIEYQPSVALGTLAKDLQRVYRVGLKELVDRGLWIQERPLSTTTPHGPLLAALKSMELSNVASPPPGAATASRRQLPSSSASTKFEPRARSNSMYTRHKSSAQLAHAPKAQHGRVRSTFLKDRIKTWALKKRSSKHESGAVGASRPQPRRRPMPPQHRPPGRSAASSQQELTHQQVAQDAAHAGKRRSRGRGSVGELAQELNASPNSCHGEEKKQRGDEVPAKTGADKDETTMVCKGGDTAEGSGDGGDTEVLNEGEIGNELFGNDDGDDLVVVDDDDDDDDLDDEDDLDDDLDDDDDDENENDEDNDGEGRGGAGRRRRLRRRGESKRGRGGAQNADEKEFVPPPKSTPVVKEGYLRKRSSKMRKSWKRRWFVLQGGKLFYIRDYDVCDQPVFICECMFATVREADAAVTNDMSFCFEILSPNRRTYVMQAENEISMREWIDTIRTSTERLITDFGGQSQVSRTSEISTDPGTEEATKTKFAAGQLCSDPQLLAVQEANTTCADCGAAQPDWASINLGVLVCIECSGIHRSLGVHVSKVRSMTLDSWTDASKAVLEALGNEAVNAIFEAHLSEQEEWAKPEPDAPRRVKERFIQAKYVWKAFLQDATAESGAGAGGGDGSEVNCEGLEAVCASGSAPTLLRYIIHHPADKLARSGDDPHVASALHNVIARGDLASCEILLQNGFRHLVNQPDVDGRTPADIAAAHKHTHLLPIFASGSTAGTVPTGAA